MFSLEGDDRTPRSGGLWRRLGQVLKATLTYDLNDLFRRHRAIDADLLQEIEALLLGADVGVEATERILGDLHERLARNELNDAQAVRSALREDMISILSPACQPLRLPAGATTTFVLLMVGVNGSGKTTTIGKLAKRFRDDGKTVMLAAGDTFRAAAVEQLQRWGEKVGVPVVAQHAGADSASVIFDAMQSARARRIDVLIADTAGRLHTHGGLMEELKKVRRVIQKQDASAPHETMLVLDAGTGQNALNQAQQFKEAVGVSGVAITKLDGTAKGGMVFAVAEKLSLPIRLLGVGEGEEDLRDFAPEEFVDALLNG
jgi:fused signal recognition particle receptor